MLCPEPSAATNIFLDPIMAALGTTSTLQGAWPMTFAATWPISTFMSPVRPRLPIIIMSAIFSEAESTMSRKGSSP